MSITSGAGIKAICVVVKVIAEVEKHIFPKSLLGTIIQDGGMRERRDVFFHSYTLNKYNNFINK